MDSRTVLITSLVLALTSRCSTLNSRPCVSNRVAPEGRTFGLFLGQWGGQGQGNGCRPSHAEPVTEPSKPAPSGDDYDPVYSAEETAPLIKPIQRKDVRKLAHRRPNLVFELDYEENVRPPDRPPYKPRPTPSQGFNGYGVLSWLPPGIITQDKWPQRPPRPPRPQNAPGYAPGWFSGWFNQGSYRPPRPTRPPWNNPGDNDIKPVYEHIDEDGPNDWKPSAIVGGPNNDIVGVTQDLSSWSRPPTPRPTRPSIPGYPNTSRNKDSGIVESFLDLLFKK